MCASLSSEEKSRSFTAKNFGSVGQRAAKLLVFKVRVVKKKSATSAIPAKVCESKFCFLNKIKQDHEKKQS